MSDDYQGKLDAIFRKALIDDLNALKAELAQAKGELEKEREVDNLVFDKMLDDSCADYEKEISRLSLLAESYRDKYLKYESALNEITTSNNFEYYDIARAALNDGEK